jgi:hypothetical protein
LKGGFFSTMVYDSNLQCEHYVTLKVNGQEIRRCLGINQYLAVYQVCIFENLSEQHRSDQIKKCPLKRSMLTNGYHALESI